MAIKGGKVGSIRKMKADLKKGAGGGFTKNIPADGTMVVRFLTEPIEWQKFFQHAIKTGDKWEFFPCSEDCKGCDEGDKPTMRYLANALDVDEGKVVALVVPKSLASNIIKKYDKWTTVMDRDYELSRTGKGTDTEYDAIPESPSKMNTSRYELLDLVKILEDQLPSDDDDEEEEEEDEKPTRRRGPAATRRKSGGRQLPSRGKKSSDDDDEEEPRRSTSSLAKKTPRKRTTGLPKRKLSR